MATHFKCQQCQSSVEPHHINVVGAQGTDLNVEITCPRCHSTTMLRAQVNQFVPNNPDQNSALLEELAKQQGFSGSIQELNARIEITQEHPTVQKKGDHMSDKDVTELYNKLKGDNITIEDLLQ